MIDVVVRSMLGKGGIAFLDFYLQNSLWINGLIFLYAFLLVISRMVYRRTLEFFCTWVDERLSGGGTLERKQLIAAIKRMQIPWEQAKGASVFPFIARPSGLGIYLRNETTIEKWITAEVLAEAMLEKRKKLQS
jgi:hypothetical protein